MPAVTLRMAMESSTIRTRLRTSVPLLRHASDAWSWWITELADMLPKGVRSALLPGIDRLQLTPNGEEITASRCKAESIDRIGSFPLTPQASPSGTTQDVVNVAARSREVVLCLPPEKVLRKTISLPMVAEENLHEVLGFEMDRHTPFPVTQVYYDFVTVARSPKENLLTLDLVVTPRAYLDELLTSLEDLGLQPHQVTLCQGETLQLLPLNLLPTGDRQQRTEATRYLNYVFGALALFLLLGVIALPLWNKLHVIRTLEARIELATSNAEVTRRLDEEVRRLESDSLFLTEKKLATPLVLELMNELTHILPDDTWITRLTISGREVQLQGQSAAAAALIPLIESARYLDNPRFRSPVTRTPKTNLESFNLSAEITGGNFP